MMSLRRSARSALEWLGFAQEDAQKTATDPYHATKDGYGPFTALATFALAQGAALTAVAKGEGRDTLVLIIYAVAVFVTFIWVLTLLRTRRWEKREGVDAPAWVRAYDRPSTVYGRWALVWTVLLGGVLSVLGWLELLPNQTVRVHYNKGEIGCEPFTYLDLVSRAGSDRIFLEKWIEWIYKSTPAAQKQHFMWVEQKSPFPESYKPFEVTLTCNKPYVLGERVAFLVKVSPGDYRPSYRQLRIADAWNVSAQRSVIDIPDATVGEYVVVLVFVRDSSGKEFPKKEKVNFRLLPHYGANP